MSYHISKVREIKQYLKEGHSVREVARMTGVHRNTVTNVKYGRTKGRTKPAWRYEERYLHPVLRNGD